MMMDSLSLEQPLAGFNGIHPSAVAAVRQELISDADSLELARTFKALADPTRVRLISALLNQELCVYDLSAVLGMAQSAVSHQLRLLRDLRLVKSRRLGREIIYMLDDEHIRNLYQLAYHHIQHR